METARLNYRPIQLGDEEYIFPKVDEELTRYWIGWEPPHNIEEVRTDIQKTLDLTKQGKKFHFLAFNENNKEFIGLCGIVTNMPPHDEEFEIDIWVKKSAQHQGYATEMVGAIIKWAKENLPLSYLVYSVTEGNAYSEAIIKKMGAPELRKWVNEKRGQLKNVKDYKIKL